MVQSPILFYYSNKLAVDELGTGNKKAIWVKKDNDKFFSTY